MKISYNWLKDLIDIDLSANDLAEKLTLIGLELDAMHETEDDFILDIETTSNRGDCLSHLGVAREISAITDNRVKQLDNAEGFGNKGSNDLVTVQDSDICHRFTARIIENVTIKPSPKWLVQRLEAIGERSINNVADITNYVMHELGQPMHAFDFDKIEGHKIVVRRARKGENITTLDEVDRKLDESMLMICDAVKPIAVGGVMGGFNSSITEDTKTVILEVAYFDRDNVRETSRRLNLSSEASYHFERGVDIENLIRASNRATELICELAGGTTKEFIDEYPTEFTQNIIESSDLKSEIKRLAGLDIEQSDTDSILTNLGIEKLDATSYKSPTWRHDLSIEEDLVEEVVRITGYDKIQEELPYALSSGEYQANEKRKKRLRQTLATLGFDEAISYSFIDTSHDETFETIPTLIDESLEEKLVTIKDPIIDGATRMRQSLLSGLLDAVKVNINQQNKNVKLFELGRVFAEERSDEKLPKESEHLGIVLTGNVVLEQIAQSSRKLDFFDLKGAVDASLDAIKLSKLKYSPEKIKHLQDGQSAQILFDGKVLGSIGRLNSAITNKYKFKQAVYLAELDVQTLLENDTDKVSYKPLPKFPSIVRDVSFLVKRTMTFDEIRNEIETQGFDYCDKVEFLEVFEGKNMSDDERSLTIRLEYRSDDRTLVEEEVDLVHKKLLNTLEANLTIKQR